MTPKLIDGKLQTKSRLHAQGFEVHLGQLVPHVCRKVYELLCALLPQIHSSFSLLIIKQLSDKENQLIKTFAT